MLTPGLRRAAALMNQVFAFSTNRGKLRNEDEDVGIVADLNAVKLRRDHADDACRAGR